jgi:prepilin-type N-terminal cleavage/methylation domain-containing protein
MTVLIHNDNKMYARKYLYTKIIIKLVHYNMAKKYSNRCIFLFTTTVKDVIMQKRNKGFTLIELVIVIVILGILAVVAIPKFIDLSGTANTAALNGVAGALSAASASNYAGRKANASLGSAVTKCSDVGSLLQGGMPTQYSISPAIMAVSVDTTVTCTVINSAANVSTSFTATGIN